MAAKVGFLEQSNGTKLPLLGLGTWQATDEEEFSTALRTAFDLGYRYIDTAEFYKNEHIVGKVVDEYIKAGKLKREDIFITTKLPMYAHDIPQQMIDESLKKLCVDYIDLYLIHAPFVLERDESTFWAKALPDGTYAPAFTPLIDTWRVLEQNYREGKLKSIGISNFNVQQIKDFYEKAEIKPQNLQVECHILLQQKELFDLCRSLNMTFTAYATIGSPARSTFQSGKSFVDQDPKKYPLVVRLAEKYNKTPAQILLRQMTQRGISVIPKSTNPKRLAENLDVFDFELTKEEMEEFAAIDVHHRLFLFDFAKNHPWHPWLDEIKKIFDE